MRSFKPTVRAFDSARPRFNDISVGDTFFFSKALYQKIVRVRPVPSALPIYNAVRLSDGSLQEIANSTPVQPVQVIIKLAADE